MKKLVPPDLFQVCARQPGRGLGIPHPGGLGHSPRLPPVALHRGDLSEPPRGCVPEVYREVRKGGAGGGLLGPAQWLTLLRDLAAAGSPVPGSLVGRGQGQISVDTRCGVSGVACEVCRQDACTPPPSHDGRKSGLGREVSSPKLICSQQEPTAQLPPLEGREGAGEAGSPFLWVVPEEDDRLGAIVTTTL